MTTNTATFDVDPSAVFAVLADGWSYSNWVTGTSHMRAVEATWPAAGSRLFHATGVWPAVACDETRVEQMVDSTLLVLTARARPAGEARVRIELSAVPGGRTRVRMTEFPVSGPGRWLHNPINDAVIHRRNTESLHRLRCIAERRTAAGAVGPALGADINRPTAPGTAPTHGASTATAASARPPRTRRRRRRRRHR